MLITKLGEFGLIERFRKRIKTDSSVVKGSGDDCAVLKFSKDKYQLFSSDMLVEGVDFYSQEKPYLIGRKALAVSLSDIAACAGIARHCVVSLGLPGNTSLKFVDQLFRGMLDLAKVYKVNIVGGDLSRSKKIIIDVSILGLVEKKNLVLRSGAKPGDIIFVTGSLGGSIKGKHLRFIPRVAEARFLVKHFKVNAMIDISDGLTQDLGHILEESKVGAIIYEDLIPLSKEARNLEDTLYSGEDFELLFTLARKEAKKLCMQGLTAFKVIGEISKNKGELKLVSAKGRERKILAHGFRHF
jgi:thiamine-monophosphate kinase